MLSREALRIGEGEGNSLTLREVRELIDDWRLFRHSPNWEMLAFISRTAALI